MNFAITSRLVVVPTYGTAHDADGVAAIAALFLFHRLRSGTAEAALVVAASSVFGLLRRTAEAGSREILTVAAQDEFVTPSRVFAAVAC